jgi:hypothetical protein
MLHKSFGFMVETGRTCHDERDIRGASVRRATLMALLRAS